MQGAVVLAGASGLDRRVRGINIIEVPDVWQWLEGGELLLTAGYAWHDHPERMLELARQLEQARISGIAFKLGRYLDRVPDEVLTRAEEIGLPVIKLPADVAYRDVLESLYGSLAARAGLYDLSQRAKQAFIHFSLDEQSIDKVAGALARQLRAEVHVVDLLDEEIVSSTATGATRRAAFDDLDERAAEVHRLDAQELRRSPTEVRVAGARGLAVGLVVGHRTQGWLVAAAHEVELDDAAAGAVAHAGELMSFLLLKRLALFEGRQQAGGLFLKSLMFDPLSNEEAAERALTLGLRLTRACTVFVLGSLGHLPADAFPAVARDIDRALAGTPHVLAPHGAIPALLGLVQAGDGGEVAFLTRMLDSAQARADEGGWGALVLGSGSPATGLEGVRRSRSEATIAFETAVRLRQAGLVAYDSLGVERLLAQIPRGRMAEDYVRSLLGPLEDDPELLRTVEVYLQHGGNKVAAAAAIPLHRSSLVYRLQKASALLGTDLDCPEQRLELWFAIRLRRLHMLP